MGWRSGLGVLLAVAALPSLTLADVVPPPRAAAVHPGPMVGDPAEASRLVEDSIEVRLTMTSMHVRMRLSLEATPSSTAPWLLGAPQSRTGLAIPGSSRSVADLLGEESSPPPPGPVRLLSKEPESWGAVDVLLPPGVTPFVQAFDWADARATIDGRPVEVEARSYTLPGNRDHARWDWRVLEVPRPEGGAGTLELSFVQPLYAWHRRSGPPLVAVGERCSGAPLPEADHIEVEASLLVDLASAFAGVVDRGVIRVEPRLPEHTSLCVVAEGAPVEEAADGTLSITREGWEPADGVRIVLRQPVAGVDAPEPGDPGPPPDGLRPVWSVHDRLLRFARSGPAAGLDDDGTEAFDARRLDLWLALLEDLRATALRDPDPPSRAFAAALLEQMAQRCHGDEREREACGTWVTGGAGPSEAAPRDLRPVPDLALYRAGDLRGVGWVRHFEASAFSSDSWPISDAFDRVRQRRRRAVLGAVALVVVLGLVGLVVRRRG